MMLEIHTKEQVRKGANEVRPRSLESNTAGARAACPLPDLFLLRFYFKRTGNFCRWVDNG